MRAFIFSVSAMAVLAAPASSLAETPAKPAPNTMAPARSDDSFVKATPQAIQAALRSDTLSQAAFFATQFDHDPTNAQLGLYLSNAQRAPARYQEAADTAHAVLLFAPNNPDALLAAARAHIAGGNGFYAIDPLKHLSDLKPKDWQAWSLLGVAYDQTKRPEDAQAAWQTALKLSPDNPAVLTNMAMARVSAGDFTGAEPLLRTAVAQKGSTIQERQDLALVLGLQGKMPEAERLLRQDLPPEVADANLAWLQQAMQSQAPVAVPASMPVAASAASPARSWDGLKAAGG